MNTFTNRKEVIAYVQDIAKWIVEENENHGTDIHDLVAETADNSEHVIYHYKAHALLNAVWPEDIDQADYLIEDAGGHPEGSTYWQVQTLTAYWVLRYLIELHVVARMDQAYF